MTRRPQAHDPHRPASPSGVPEDVAARLYLSLGRLVRMVRRGAAAEIGPGAFSALATVVRSGPLRLGDLAAREGVAPPTLTRIVASLEDQGLVAREVDPEDRRATLVAATESGSRLVLGMGSSRAAMLRQRIEALPATDRAALQAALPALEAMVEDEGGEPG